MIKLTFTGDIMLNGLNIDKYKTSQENSYEFDIMFDEVRDFLSQSDFVVGNLETPITENYNEIKKEKYRFTSPIEYVEAIRNAGIDFVSTANNHCLDNGIEGIKKTIESLNKVGIKNTGISYKNDIIFIKNIKNMKVAILAYTYGTNAFSNNTYLSRKHKYEYKVNLLQEQELHNIITRKLYQSNNVFVRIIRKIAKRCNVFQFNKPIYERTESSGKQKREIKKKIKECKKNGADYIIMCMHEGGQYNIEPLKKTKRTVDFLCYKGIDLVVGNHEHVIHNIEQKGKKIIAYSLGNFVSDSGVTEEPFDKMSEYSILLNIYLTKDDNEVKFKKCTFTILKTILNEERNDGTIKVKLLYDLISECDNERQKRKLLNDNQRIINIVLGSNLKNSEIKKEYDIIA